MTPKDKEMHFWAGVSVSILALVFFKAIDISYCSLWVSGTVTVIAVGKEFKDLMDYGKFDYRDAVYTVAGGMVGIVLSFF